MTAIDIIQAAFPCAEVLERIESSRRRENPRHLGNQANLDTELQWWRTWNASRPPLDLNTVRNERDSYVRHTRKKKWWSE